MVLIAWLFSQHNLENGIGIFTTGEFTLITAFSIVIAVNKRNHRLASSKAAAGQRQTKKIVISGKSTALVVVATVAWIGLMCG